MAYLKPLPEIREEHRQFWESLRSGVFRVPFCERCGKANWPPYPACRSCHNEAFDWRPVGTGATVYSYTIAHRGPGAFQEDAPYAIVLAELDDAPGVLVLGNLPTGIDQRLEIGEALRIVFEDIPGEDVTLWRFMPVRLDDAARTG